MPLAPVVDQLFLAARDPHHLFATWRVAPATRIRTLRQLGPEAEAARPALRIIEDGREGRVLDLPPEAEHELIADVAPETAYAVEVGLRTRGGRFVALVRSAPATTPPAGPSGGAEVRWVSASAPTTPATAPPAVRRLPRVESATPLAHPGSSDLSPRA